MFIIINILTAVKGFTQQAEARIDFDFMEMVSLVFHINYRVVLSTDGSSVRWKPQTTSRLNNCPMPSFPAP